MKENIIAIIPIAIAAVLLAEILTIIVGVLARMSASIRNGIFRTRTKFEYGEFMKNLREAWKNRSISGIFKSYYSYPSEAMIFAFFTIPIGFIIMVAWAYVINIVLN